MQNRLGLEVLAADRAGDRPGVYCLARIQNDPGLFEGSDEAGAGGLQRRH
jgi:hypothetical protein